MDVDYLLRPGVPDDAAPLISFWLEAAENDGRPIDHEADIEQLIERDPDALLVADASGEIVGTLIVGWDGWRFHLYRLAVHPDWRGRGVARAMVEEAERYCMRLGSHRVDAMVLEGNDLGTGFWQALGYTLQPDWRRWVRSLA
ncbi:MAG TPA: GNAT family N-acetyltransferase [Mycobacteriales bacterium]|nr:GNAT family N-acetyltransferase [Mycobacteriales bacterium]